jgi:hypothetical protein
VISREHQRDGRDFDFFRKEARGTGFESEQGEGWFLNINPISKKEEKYA